MTRGNASPPHPAPEASRKSLANFPARISSGKSDPIAFEASPSFQGFDDDLRIRSTIAATLHARRLSREQIADAMSLMLGKRVTEQMLNAYSAPSKDLHRFPAAWQRAFCQATGDDSLLRCCAELAGFRLLTPADALLLDLGREYIRQKRAAENLASIEARLAEAQL